jgi:hypothetical protein
MVVAGEAPPFKFENGANTSVENYRRILVVKKARALLGWSLNRGYPPWKELATNADGASLQPHKTKFDEVEECVALCAL